MHTRFVENEYKLRASAVNDAWTKPYIREHIALTEKC